VLVIGELRKGIENIRLRDEVGAGNSEKWLDDIKRSFGNRILPVDRDTAEAWGRSSVPDPISTVDGLLAATAQEHGLVLVTRNVKDVARTGCRVLNPFEPRA